MAGGAGQLPRTADGISQHPTGIPEAARFSGRGRGEEIVCFRAAWLTRLTSADFDEAKNTLTRAGRSLPPRAIEGV